MAKEKELSEFKDKHNIHIKGEKETQPAEEEVKSGEKSSGVLVAQDTS